MSTIFSVYEWDFTHVGLVLDDIFVGYLFGKKKTTEVAHLWVSFLHGHTTGLYPILFFFWLTEIQYTFLFHRFQIVPLWFAYLVSSIYPSKIKKSIKCFLCEFEALNFVLITILFVSWQEERNTIYIHVHIHAEIERNLKVKLCFENLAVTIFPLLCTMLLVNLTKSSIVYELCFREILSRSIMSNFKYSGKLKKQIKQNWRFPGVWLGELSF